MAYENAQGSVLRFASAGAANALLVLAARRIDDAAERIDEIGEVVQQAGDVGPAREAYRRLAQQIVDEAEARAKKDLEDLGQLLDRTGALLGRSGLSQLNGARLRIRNACVGAR